MSNILDIDLYQNGYNNFGINCLDEAIAYASGYFNYYNYFLYCFIYSAFTNWGDIHFPQNQDIILGKLGLSIKNNEIKDSKFLLPIIKSKIDNQNPLCIVVDYFHLFYNNDFYKRVHTPHGIVVTGYDSERSIITIRENCHVGWKAPFYEFNLEERMLQNIFEQSNDYFKKFSSSFYSDITNTYYNEGEAYFCDCIYSIEKDSNAYITCCNDLLKEYLSIYNNKHNNLIQTVNAFDYLIQLVMKYKLAAAQFKRNYLESVEMFLSIIETTSELLKKDKQVKNKFAIFKDYYLKKRSVIVSEMLVNAIRRVSLLPVQKQRFISEISILDEELFNFLSEFYLLSINGFNK